MEHAYDLRRAKQVSLDDSIKYKSNVVSLADYRRDSEERTRKYSEAGKLGREMSPGEKGLYEHREAVARSSIDSLRDVIDVKTDLDLFYEGIEERLDTTAPKYGSLQEAEDIMTRAYLLKEAMQHSGNKSEIARRNGVDRKTVERNYKKAGIDSKVFDPVALNNADPATREQLLYQREELKKELQDTVNPYDTKSVMQAVNAELDVLRERNPQLYDQVRPEVESKIENIASAINTNAYVNGNNSNSMFLEALYKPTLKEAQEWVRGRVTENTLIRNKGDVAKAAEELEVSEKTVRRVMKKHEEKIEEMQNVYMLYARPREREDAETERIDQDLVRELHAVVKREMFAPAFEDIPGSSDGRTWKIIDRKAA